MPKVSVAEDRDTPFSEDNVPAGKPQPSPPWRRGREQLTAICVRRISVQRIALARHDRPALCSYLASSSADVILRRPVACLSGKSVVGCGVEVTLANMRWSVAVERKALSCLDDAR